MNRSLLLCAALLALAPGLAEAARLEVYPREVSARPGDTLRFTAVIYRGPAGKEQAALPPTLVWSASSGSIGAQGVLKVTKSAPATIRVTAKVGGLEARGTIRVLHQDLQVFPVQSRVLASKVLQFTVLDTRGGGARTPAKATWSADRGKIDDLGRYWAPASPGPDTVRIKVGERVAIAQVLVESTPAGAGSGGADPGSGAQPQPSQPAQPQPPPSVPLRVKSWNRSGGLNSKHTVVVEIYSAEAAHIKLMGRRRTGTESTLVSRAVKPGDKLTLSTVVSSSWREVELQLLDEAGEVISRQRRMR